MRWNLQYHHFWFFIRYGITCHNCISPYRAVLFFEHLCLPSLQSSILSRMWILWFLAQNHFFWVLFFWINHDLMHAVGTSLLAFKWYCLPNLLHLLLSQRAKPLLSPTALIQKHEWFCVKWVSIPKLNPPNERLLRHHFPINQLLILGISPFLFLASSIKWSLGNSIISPISLSILLNVNTCSCSLYLSTELWNAINQSYITQYFPKKL